MFGWVKLADVEDQLKRQDAAIRNLSSQIAKLRREIRRETATTSPVTQETPEEDEETPEELVVKKAKKNPGRPGELLFQRVG